MMNFKKPESKGKAQLKCFTCRKALTLKDGKWVTIESQQVFLCPTCQGAQTKSKL